MRLVTDYPRKPLQLMFKGDRNYIQGGDIFNCLEEAAPQLVQDQGAFVSAITFRQFTRKDCIIATKEPEAEKLVAEATLRNDSGSTAEVWIEETEEEPAGRYTFDEDSIVSPARLEGDTISGPCSSRYSPIEVAIALTKRLNYHRFPNPSGKWVFGQLELSERLPRECESLSVRMRSALAARFTVNDITTDGRLVGTMRFIVGTP